jgi:hypothetical protein
MEQKIDLPIRTVQSPEQSSFDAQAFMSRLTVASEEFRKSRAFPAVTAALVGGLVGALIVGLLAGRRAPQHKAETPVVEPKRESKLRSWLTSWSFRDVIELATLGASLAKQVQELRQMKSK